jgi:hypothetical protein
MFRLLSVSLVAFTLGSATSQAALFSGPAAFTTTPWSQMGTVTNNLVITNTPTGFVVSGQAIINVGSSSTGLLVEWIVERPLDPTYAGPFNLQTTSILDGFSAPPIGTFNPTSGVARSEFTSHPASFSNIPVYLVNGLDIPPWSPQITVNSPVFVYTPAAGLVLRQHFFVDGSYGGPGGNWIIDVPLESQANVAQNVIPEPSSFWLAGSGILLWGLATRLRSQRRPRTGADHCLHRS